MSLCVCGGGGAYVRMLCVCALRACACVRASVCASERAVLICADGFLERSMSEFQIIRIFFNSDVWLISVWTPI